MNDTNNSEFFLMFKKEFEKNSFRIIKKHFLSITSTHDEIKKKIDWHSYSPDKILIYTAGSQTNGITLKKGKNWSSPFGNFYFSLLSKNLTKKSFLLFQIMSLVAFETIKSFLMELKRENLIEKLKIKWPNDIYFCGKKLAGILCESIYKGSAVFQILSIGVNLNSETKEYTDENIIKGFTTFYNETGFFISLDEFEGSFLENLFFLIKKINSDNLNEENSLINEYQQKLAFLDQEVFVYDKESVFLYKGVFKGVDEKYFGIIQKQNGSLSLLNTESIFTEKI